MKTASEQTFFENLDKVKDFLEGQKAIWSAAVTCDGQIVLYWDWDKVSPADIEKEMERMGFSLEDYLYGENQIIESRRTVLK